MRSSVTPGGHKAKSEAWSGTIRSTDVRKEVVEATSEAWSGATRSADGRKGEVRTENEALSGTTRSADVRTGEVESTGGHHSVEGGESAAAWTGGGKDSKNTGRAQCAPSGVTTPAM